ncbi:MAG TPA: trypsin-like peptidase domain-containing protein [Actinomycetota bacterium]
MKRSLFPVMAVAALAVTACTRTVIERVPVRSSPATVDVGAADPSMDPIVRVVEAVRPAVVNVTTNLFQPNPLGGESGRGVGTGFVIRSDGIVVTNFHVVEHAQRITVITPPPDSTRYTARVIGGDQNADLAVLKIQASGLHSVPLGNSGRLELGERVVALGYALALPGGPTVTSGIVSALGRTIQAQDPNCDTCKNGVRTYTGVVQTDAAINPGNSGGPLVNLSGQVVGINTAGANQAENIGFAIATNAARSIIDEAATNPSAPVAYLGITTQDVSPSLALQFGLPVQSGALVLDVVPGGPADRAGINHGDVIVGLDGEDVIDSTSLRELLLSHQPGDRVAIGVVTEGGQKETITATLGVNPLPQT